MMPEKTESGAMALGDLRPSQSQGQGGPTIRGNGQGLGCVERRTEGVG